MKRSFLVLVVILAGLCGLAIGIATARVRRIMRARSAFSSVRAAGKSGTTRGAAAQSDEREVIRFASNPQAVPAFDAKDLDGNPISTAEWKGKVVLVTFWATWCPPCREEIPMLIGLESRYKDRLQIVGVSLDDDPPSEVKQFVQKEGINYPVVMATRKIVAEFGGVPALPTSFVVNQDGNVVQKHVGLYPPTVYDNEVRSLLGLPVDAKVETFEDTGQIFLKNASLATELPNVNLSGLTADQKRAVLK
ncbi:MAG: TlpA disulfide reductase family protein, partial [Blastocatellia bacterium]